MSDDLNVLPNDQSGHARAEDARVSATAALARLRAYISDRSFKAGERLPPERVLSADLGLNRAELRRALQVLEDENLLWRHVGKGTFLTGVDPATAQTEAIGKLAQQVSPADVLRARATLEPALAREAALYASASAISALRVTMDRSMRAETWREYEAFDTEFHRQIAESSGSTTLLALFDQVNMLRRMVSWGQVKRVGTRPAADHSSFSEHARIVDEIAVRDPDAAQSAMRAHLRSVENRLFG